MEHRFVRGRARWPAADAHFVRPLPKGSRLTWLTFFAAPEDFPVLLQNLLTGTGRRLYEVYSTPGHRARTFASGAEAAELELGLDPQGNGVAAHLALWIPEIMPAPSLRRIRLSPGVAAAAWRETVEGCGLIWLHAGGLNGETITASSLGWFSQRTAEAKCTVEPGPSAVNWSAHLAVTRALTRLLRRDLAAAHASRRPVLRHALERHRSGARLVSGLGVKQEFRVEAA